VPSTTRKVEWRLHPPRPARRCRRVRLPWPPSPCGSGLFRRCLRRGHSEGGNRSKPSVRPEAALRRETRLFGPGVDHV